MLVRVIGGIKQCETFCSVVGYVQCENCQNCTVGQGPRTRVRLLGRRQLTPPHQLGGLGNAVNSHRRVQGRVPAAKMHIIIIIFFAPSVV